MRLETENFPVNSENPENKRCEVYIMPALTFREFMARAGSTISCTLCSKYLLHPHPLIP